MGQPSLPDNLGEIEHRLNTVERPEPSAAMRARVMADVRGCLRHDRQQQTGSYAAVLAASVLIWINLSLSAATVTDYRLSAQAEPGTLASLGAEISQLLPEVSAQDAARQALLLRCGARLVCCPRHDTKAWSMRASDSVEELLP